MKLVKTNFNQNEVSDSDLQGLMTEIRPYADDLVYNLVRDFVKSEHLTLKRAMKFIGLVSFIVQYYQDDIDDLDDENDDLLACVDDLEEKVKKFKEQNAALAYKVDKLSENNKALKDAINHALTELVKGEPDKASKALSDAR